MTSLARAEDDKILKKGEIAPFYGVLVSEPRYREYSGAVKEADFLRHAEPFCAPPAPLTEQEHRELQFGTGGVLLGIVIGIMIVK